MKKQDEGLVHTHSLLEFHSAVTQLPKGLAVPPTHVNALLRGSILNYVKLLSLPAREIAMVQKRAGEMGLIGGIVYDLYHLHAATRESVERFYTFNTTHFQAIADSDFLERIVAP